jgi:hypothetical protein
VCGVVSLERACVHDASFVDDIEIEPVLEASLDLLFAPS